MTEADEVLIARIRPLIKRRRGFREQKMFGGVCFMLNGNMCFGTWKGSLCVRLDKQDHDQTQAEPNVRPMDITGRVMRGWALVEPDGIAADADLKSWIDRAAAFAGKLPAK